MYQDEPGDDSDVWIRSEQLPWSVLSQGSATPRFPGRFGAPPAYRLKWTRACSRGYGDKPAG